MKTWTRVAPGIYRHKSGSLYCHPVIGGKPNFRKLKAHSIRLAKDELAARKTDQSRAAFGLAADPYEKTRTIGQLIEAYKAAGCPDQRRQARTGKPWKQEISRLSLLGPWFGGLTPGAITQRLLDEYADERTSKVLERQHAGQTGARAVDLELNTLKNVFKLAVRAGQLTRNPLDFERPAYCDSRKVRHCRDAAPRSAEELHKHALFFFEDPSAAVFGWQTLFEALTGCRTSEALALRMDAKEHEPGYVADGILWLARAKGGCNNWIKVHPALEAWLTAFRTWRGALDASSTAWFPSAGGSGQRPEALSRALGDSAALICPG